jgi:hypothetical protein
LHTGTAFEFPQPESNICTGLTGLGYLIGKKKKKKKKKKKNCDVEEHPRFK